MHHAPVHDEKAVPARVGDSAGVLANARLTGVAGAVLLVLLALEGATILRILPGAAQRLMLVSAALLAGLVFAVATLGWVDSWHQLARF